MSWHSKRPCSICGTEFEASRGDARFCSANCRKVASRQKQHLDKEYERALSAIRFLEEYVIADHRLKQDALKLLSKLDVTTAAITNEYKVQRHIYQAGDLRVTGNPVTS